MATIGSLGGQEDDATIVGECSSQEKLVQGKYVDFSAE